MHLKKKPCFPSSFEQVEIYLRFDHCLWTIKAYIAHKLYFCIPSVEFLQIRYEERQKNMLDREKIVASLQDKRDFRRKVKAYQVLEWELQEIYSFW